MIALDLTLFNFINSFAGRWHWLDVLGTFFAEYFLYLLLLALFIFLLKDFKKYWRMVAESLIAAVFVRFVVVEIMRRVFFRPRPFVYHNVHLLLPSVSANEAAFPSGHASFCFALSTIIYGYNKKAGVFFYIGSFLIVIARVFVGVHWPSDILAGAVLGIVMGWILNKIFKKFSLGAQGGT